MPLHDAKSVPEAQSARQALKADLKAGKWKTPQTGEVCDDGNGDEEFDECEAYVALAVRTKRPIF